MDDGFMERLGARLKASRSARGLTLGGLASASGVSASMISEVERGTKVPTVLVIARLATALGVTVSRLLGEDRAERVILLREADQHAITDLKGWQRRILSPAVPGREFEFIRTTVPGGVVIGEFAPHTPGSREYVAVERGSLTVTLDGVPHRLGRGDSLYYEGDCTHAFANEAEEECVYYTAMDVREDL